MGTSSLRRLAFVFLISCFSISVQAQKVQEPASDNHPDWVKPYQPFRIAGNLYYVGGYDLACYLITSKKGHILINTGLASSASAIKESVEALGFKMKDIKLLLTTQAHFDHLGAMAAIKKSTKATMWANKPEARTLTSGGETDITITSGMASFEPIVPDSLLTDRAVIKWGADTLVLLSHPGHTQGSCSYLFSTKDDKQSYTILIANLPTIVTDKKFTEETRYPTIQQDYAYTLATMKNLRFDLWVASHTSQFDLHEKRKESDAYNPLLFADTATYYNAIERLQKRYEEHLKK